MSQASAKAARGNFVWPYGIAILAIALALGLKLALASKLHGEASYLFFMPAILIASALGGWGPGLLATSLGLLLGIYFIIVANSVMPSDVINALAFALVGIGVSWRGELLSRFRRSAASSAADAHARAAHLQSILDNIPEAMIVIDERGLMQSFSATAERLFGFAASDVLGKNVKMLMPSPYQQEHDSYLDRYKPHRRAPYHRHRSRCGRTAEGRFNLSDGAGGRGDACARSALLHGLHPRPH
jgi:two-component system sensor kinase FixL